MKLVAIVNYFENKRFLRGISKALTARNSCFHVIITERICKIPSAFCLLNDFSERRYCTSKVSLFPKTTSQTLPSPQDSPCNRLMIHNFILVFPLKYFISSRISKNYVHPSIKCGTFYPKIVNTWKTILWFSGFQAR